MAKKKNHLSDEEFEQQFAVAKQRGKEALAHGAYASVARYDSSTARLLVELANGTTLLIPTQLIQGLASASKSDLAVIEVLGVGSGLYWPRLEVDISVAGLLQGIFGSQNWMSELGRAGGKATSLAKQSAARTNGSLGGRPKKAHPLAA
jgi:hypothetical protein